MKNKKRGISLIMLVLTIMVMIILASAVLITLSNTNIVNEAKAGVDEYNKKQNDILAMLDDMDKYLEGMPEQNNQIVMTTQEVTGTNGEVTLPLALNDASQMYVMDIQSDLYSGPVVMNTYDVDGLIIGAAGLTEDAAYPLELRHITALSAPATMSVEETDSTETTKSALDELFGTENMVVIMYQSDGTTAKVSYASEEVGSEIKVTKISRIEREYDKFAKILLNIYENGKLTTNDIAECIRFCMNSEKLGYDYANQLFSQMTTETTDEGTDTTTNEESNTAPQLSFDETLERQTLTNILNNRMEDVEMLNYTFNDQMLIVLGSFASNLAQAGITFNYEDKYTFATYIQESEYLNEIFMRVVGNTMVPFTLLFSDMILIDLNEDGVLGGNFNCATEEFAMIVSEAGNAGIGVRTISDLLAVIGDDLAKLQESQQGLTPMQQFELSEVTMVLMMNGGANPMEGGVPVALPWLLAYEIYGEKEMDKFFTEIFEAGQTINLAGLKMAWNSVITPELYAAQIGMLPAYDLRNDTEALSQQKVSSIVDDLYAYVEYSKTLPQETTKTGTTE